MPGSHFATMWENLPENKDQRGKQNGMVGSKIPSDDKDDDNKPNTNNG